MRLRTKFESVYLDSKIRMEMLGNQDDAHSPLNQAVTSYQAQLGPDAVSPSISAVSAMLAKYADALEKKFDAKIAKMHKQLKVAAEDLGLEDFEDITCTTDTQNWLLLRTFKPCAYSTSRSVK